METKYIYVHNKAEFDKYKCTLVDWINRGEFISLSCQARCIYQLMISRSALSLKNGWCDESGRVFIYLSNDEITKTVNISSHNTINKKLKELESKNLIYIEKQCNKPNRIFVVMVSNSQNKLEEPNNKGSEIDQNRTEQYGKRSNIDDIETKQNGKKSKFDILNGQNLTHSINKKKDIDMIDNKWMNNARARKTKKSKSRFDGQKHFRRRLEQKLKDAQYSPWIIEAAINALSDACDCDSEYELRKLCDNQFVDITEIKKKLLYINFESVEAVLNRVVKINIELISNMESYLKKAFVRECIRCEPRSNIVMWSYA